MQVPRDILLPLKRISPSKYTAISKCAYRVVLANSCLNPLLPYPPANHLGNVIHECIRLIVINRINTESEFNDNWSQLIEREEKALENMGFGFLTPLIENVPGYAIKRMQVKSLLKRRERVGISKLGRNQKKSVLTEKWLETRDSLIGGFADLIINFDGYIKLSDFKSGKIFSLEEKVKDEYVVQLKLYAHMYSEIFEKYPDELSIIDLNEKEYTIAFTPEECEILATNAREVLLEINFLIENNDRKALANPDSSNCNSCLYRPACEFYWNLPLSETDSSFRDIKGNLSTLRHFRNGNLNAVLIRDGRELTISHLGSEYLPFLTSMVGRNIAFYNVKLGEIPERYQAIKTTKVYES